MSGAGRGTPRVSPVTQAPPSEQLTADLVVTSVPWAWWHAGKTLNVAPQVLAATYVAYPIGGLSIPLGATRGSLVGTYTPDMAGGFPVFQFNWDVLGTRAYRIANVAAITFPGADTEQQSAQEPVFGEAFALPPSPDTNAITFLLPFWVPPVPKLSSAAAVVLRPEVREGSANNGTVDLVTAVYENFGEAQGVARL